MKRLVLIDGHAIIHRAYHAIPVLTSRSGQQTNAVYGFVLMLLRVVAYLKPTHLAVAFDLPVPTFRHAAYIAYQAHRPHADQELKDQVELVREVVEAAGIPVYTAAGFEADDVIGTLACQAIGNRQQAIGRVDEVVIVTGDRDIMQLVDDRKRIRVYAPVRGLSEAQMFDEEAVEEYVGVAPAQIVDYKALVGDASDNYPGVPGIGPKTAVELLRKFGSLEDIYCAISQPLRLSDNSAPSASLRAGSRDSALSRQGRHPLEPASDTSEQRSATAELAHRGEIGPTVVQKLKDGREGAILSKKLATIICDVPVEFIPEEAEIGDFSDNQKFIEKLQELGFRSLVARVKGKSDQFKSRSRSRSENGDRDGGQMELV